jgi:hypothetical protein
VVLQSMSLVRSKAGGLLALIDTRMEFDPSKHETVRDLLANVGSI